MKIARLASAVTAAGDQVERQFARHFNSFDGEHLAVEQIVSR